MSRKITTTVQVDMSIAERVRLICAEKHWSFSAVTTRLLERFVDGEFSGSLADVISSDAAYEPGFGGLDEK